MYVDLGKRRGRLHFSWRELCIMAGLISSAIGYVVRSEVKFAALNAQVQQCERELEILKPHGAATEVGSK